MQQFRFNPITHRFDLVETGITPGSAVETLTGNSGGAVSPDGSGNIDVVGDGTTIDIVGNPGTNTLTVSVINPIEDLTLTGNTGGPLSPTAGNWNIVGTSTNGIQVDGAVSTLTTRMNSPYADGDFSFESQVGGETRTLTVQNTVNAAGSQARQLIQVAGATSGDVFTNYSITGIRNYSLGIDNSDSDRFKINTAANPSTGSPFFTYDPGNNNVSFFDYNSGADVTIIKDGGGTDVTLGMANTGTAAGDDCFISCFTSGATTDSYLRCIGSAGQYAIGVDTSDSGAFKITQAISATPSTGTICMRSSTTGQVTFPNQPAFLARKSAVSNNQTGNNTVATVVFDTEDFDIGGNYNNGTGTFTAPVAGIYRFSTAVLLDNLGATALVGNVQFFWAGTTLSDTNQMAVGIVRDNLNRTGLQSSILLSLAATNTVVVRVTVGGVGADTVGVFGDGNFTTYFCGELVS